MAIAYESNVLSESIYYLLDESKNMSFFVYILRSADNSLYIGQTNNLEKRIHEHIEHLQKAAKFTKELEDLKLVYKEEYLSRLDSMRREKQLKGWTRAKKEALIIGDLLLLKKL